MASAISANRAELLAIANSVATEKMIDKSIVIEAMEEAIQKSARNRYGAENDIRAKLDEPLISAEDGGNNYGLPLNSSAKAPAEAPKETKADVPPEREAEGTQGGRKSQRGGNNDKPSRGRGRNDKRGGNDNRVVGLGDHTPDFIGLSFRERI